MSDDGSFISLFYRIFFFFTQFLYACTHRWGHLASISHRLETPYKDKNHPLNLIQAYIIFSVLTREKKKGEWERETCSHTLTHKHTGLKLPDRKLQRGKAITYRCVCRYECRKKVISVLSFFFNIPAQRATFTQINCCIFIC